MINPKKIHQLKDKCLKLLSELPDNHHKDTMKKRSKYQEILSLCEEFVQIEQEIQTVKQMDCSDMEELIREEIATLDHKLQEKNDQILDMLLTDEHVSHDVIMEIRAGTGGDEASLFVNDLFTMYVNFIHHKSWKMEIIEKSTNDIGTKSITFVVRGNMAFNILELEAGVHRVQRIPATEANDRIHTSTVTVAVIPEQDDRIHIEINPSDLQFDTYRSSGAGGQHVNKTDSAVRVTHIPTGIVIARQDERSQHENKRRCLRDLEIKLYQIAHQKRQSTLDQTRLEQIGTGSRGEKIRTYNYPQNRVTDHRWDGITVYQLDIIMQGSLDLILDSIHKQYKEHKSTLAWESI